MTDHDQAHHDAQSLLPWLANGTLAGTELARVQAHVHSCSTCRADLALLHTVRAAGAEPQPGLDADRALARLLPQLDEAPPAGRWRGWRAANDRNWLKWVGAAQCCVIVMLAALLLRASPSVPPPVSDNYRLLGAAPAVQGTVIVAFRPDTPEREVRRIVATSGARVVGGPTATGAWVLGSGEAPATVAARLHAEPAVTLAEPLVADGRP
jgi:hypothetical protein